MMTKRFSLGLVVFVALALLVLPAMADPHVISQGGDIFIGEQGLDITAAIGGATQIAWFAPGTNPANDAPNDIQSIANPAQFFVNPQIFVGETGTWYQWNAGARGPAAFIVKDPTLDVKIWDSTAAKDVTGKSVVAGEKLNFRVDTNMYTIVQRPDNTGVTPMVIKVKTSDGTVYNQLFQTTTVQIPLTSLGVNLSPWFWPMGNQSSGWWQTDVLDQSGNRIYKAGAYSIWVECNANLMRDNYLSPDGTFFTGKTISATRTVTIASDTVKIEASKDSVVRGNPFSVTITGRPNQRYFLWVKGTSSMSGGTVDQPPMIAADQDSVFFDPEAGPFTIGSYQFQGGAGSTIKNDTPDAPFSGTHYYASVLLSNSGTRTVGWTTSKDTKDKTYTIKVEQNFAGQIKNDEVNVKVEKGTVTVVAAGDQSYYLGEEVQLSGTNSETDNVYMFITGPNLPSAGGNLNDPRTPVINGDANSFTSTDVLEDNTWSFKWQTANLNIDAGTYTVYAVATPNNKDNLQNAQYATVSVIIRKPFVSATASQSVVAAGDKFHIVGNAQGKPSPGIMIWILGKNFDFITTTSVADDSTFDYEVTSGTTSNMAAGQYFVVVQHPMYNNKFDVFPGTGTNSGYVMGTFPIDPSRLFKIEGSGSLQGSDAAEALVQAINNPSVDDTYTKLQFLVEVPTIRIDPVTQHSVGDKFTITGTTNLAVDDEIIVEVTSSSFQPTEKTQSGEFSGATGTVKVVKGTEGFNTWSFPVDSSSFKPDEYIVKASGITVTASASTLFNVVAFTPTTVPTTIVTTVPVNTTVTTVATPTPTTVPPTTTAPGFGALVALAGLGAVAFLVVRRH